MINVSSCKVRSFQVYRSFSGKLSLKTLSVIAAAALCALALVMVGCSSSSSNAENSSDGAEGGAKSVRIGTMPTEDILPAWVAEQEGLFEANGIDAEIVVFDSAPSLSAAITAGEVDMAMTDIMRAVKLTESGADVEIDWITLGQTSEQGRFGIMTNADAPYSTLAEMAEYAATEPDSDKYAVGAAANTVPEYVFDMLLEQNGLAADAIPTVEVASLPERFSLMASGNIGAAALPASLLELGESSGMKLLADDTQGDNISQSVMVARAAFAADNADVILAVAKAWDAAVEMIAADKDAYRALLIEKANINANIADVYPISDYPFALEGEALAHPSSDIVEKQIEWMRAKSYGGESATYDEATGKISKD